MSCAFETWPTTSASIILYHNFWQSVTWPRCLGPHSSVLCLINKQWLTWLRCDQAPCGPPWHDFSDPSKSPSRQPSNDRTAIGWAGTFGNKWPKGCSTSEFQILILRLSVPVSKQFPVILLQVGAGWAGVLPDSPGMHSGRTENLGGPAGLEGSTRRMWGGTEETPTGLGGPWPSPARLGKSVHSRLSIWPPPGGGGGGGVRL